MAAEPQPKAHSDAFDVLDAANKALWLKKPHHSMHVSHTRSIWLGAETAQALDNRQIRIVDPSGQFADMFLFGERGSRKLKLLYAPSIHERPHVKASCTLKDVRVGSEIQSITNAFRIMMAFAYPAAWQVARAATEPAPASVYDLIKSGTEAKASINIPEGKLLLDVRYPAPVDSTRPLLAHVMLLPVARPSHIYYTGLILTPGEHGSFSLGESLVKGKVICTTKEHRVRDEAYIYGSGATNGVAVTVHAPPKEIARVRTVRELLQRLAPIAVSLIREATDKRKRGLA